MPRGRKPTCFISMAIRGNPVVKGCGTLCLPYRKNFGRDETVGFDPGPGLHCAIANQESTIALDAAEGGFSRGSAGAERASKFRGVRSATSALDRSHPTVHHLVDASVESHG
jgi:hypothetical protein